MTKRILKAARGRNVYEKTPIRLSVNFSMETIQPRREGNNIFKVLKETTCQTRIFYLAKLSLRNEGERKMFPDKQKLGIHHQQTCHKKCRKKFFKLK